MICKNIRTAGVNTCLTSSNIVSPLRLLSYAVCWKSFKTKMSYSYTLYKWINKVHTLFTVHNIQWFWHMFLRFDRTDMIFSAPTSGAGLVWGRWGEYHCLCGALCHPSYPHRQRRRWSVAGQWWGPSSLSNRTYPLRWWQKVPRFRLPPCFQHRHSCTTVMLLLLQLWSLK